MLMKEHRHRTAEGTGRSYKWNSCTLFVAQLMSVVTEKAPTNKWLKVRIERQGVRKGKEQIALGMPRDHLIFGTLSAWSARAKLGESFLQKRFRSFFNFPFGMKT